MGIGTVHILWGWGQCDAAVGNQIKHRSVFCYIS